MALPWNAAAMPAANSPPKAPLNMAAQKNIPRRRPSSALVYQPENRNATPAKKGASAMPRKNRHAAMPAKLWTAPEQPLTMPFWFFYQCSVAKSRLIVQIGHTHPIKP